MIGPKYLGQHLVSKPPRHRPFVDVLVLRQLLALLQRNGDAFLRLDEQMVLGEKSGEQHSVPVLVGAFVYQVRDGLFPRAITPVSELAGVGAQPPAQRALLFAHMLVSFAMMHGERLQRRTSAGLRHVASLHHSSFKVSSDFSRKGLHHCLSSRCLA